MHAAEEKKSKNPDLGWKVHVVCYDAHCTPGAASKYTPPNYYQPEHARTGPAIQCPLYAS